MATADEQAGTMNAAQKAHAEVHDKMALRGLLRSCPALRVTVGGDGPQELLANALRAANDYYGLGEDQAHYGLDWYPASISHEVRGDDDAVLSMRYECEVLIGLA